MALIFFYSCRAKVGILYEIFDSLGITKRKERLIRKYIPKEFAVTFNTERFQVGMN